MKQTLLILLLILAINCKAQYQPTPTNNNQVIKHTYYSLSYSEKNKDPEWVYYMLCPSIVNGDAIRKNHFKPDKEIKTGSAQLTDYKGSGYDRGHMCPAGSIKINQDGNNETFYLDNMCPQLHSFNAGIWETAETYMRTWAGKDSIYVVSGPIFKNPLGTIGPDKITVPAAFYKIGYCPNTNKMVAFFLRQKENYRTIFSCVVTVDQVERLTGIDFFSQLPDSVENRLESLIGKLN